MTALMASVELAAFIACGTISWLVLLTAILWIVGA